MVDKLRWGILSTARIGLKALIPAIRESSNGVVTAIASRDLPTAQKIARDMEIPHPFGSYAEMLASSAVDAVYIPLPNSMHREWTIRCAEHGKHILCEKPFALNAAEVEDMIAAARARPVLLAEAFMYRFHPQYARLKELVDEGAIGEPKLIRSAFCFRLENLQNIRMIPNLGGGALMDIGCYCVNMARLIAGREPLGVQAACAIGAQSGVDESLVAILRFSDGLIAHFDCSFQTSYREALEVQGSRGRLTVTRPVKPAALGGVGEIVLQREDETVETFKTAPANHYQLMVEDFGEAVLKNKPLAYPPEEGLANMRVIDALYESARTGRAVDLSV